VKLKELDYKTEFYWKGERYTQVVRPKFPRGKFNIVCRPSFGQGEWIDMPGGREVKPVFRIGNSMEQIQGPKQIS
jgi:hypothetical protein